MLSAKIALFSSSITPFHLALFLGVNMLVTPSSSTSGRGAPFPRAEPVATMRFAEATSVNTIIATFSKTDPMCTMFSAKSFQNSVAAAA